MSTSPCRSPHPLPDNNQPIKPAYTVNHSFNNGKKFSDIIEDLELVCKAGQRIDQYRSSWLIRPSRDILERVLNFGCSLGKFEAYSDANMITSQQELFGEVRSNGGSDTWWLKLKRLQTEIKVSCKGCHEENDFFMSHGNFTFLDSSHPYLYELGNLVSQHGYTTETFELVRDEDGTVFLLNCTKVCSKSFFTLDLKCFKWNATAKRCQEFMNQFSSVIHRCFSRLVCCCILSGEWNDGLVRRVLPTNNNKNLVVHLFTVDSTTIDFKKLCRRFNSCMRVSPVYLDWEAISYRIYGIFGISVEKWKDRGINTVKQRLRDFLLRRREGLSRGLNDSEQLLGLGVTEDFAIKALDHSRNLSKGLSIQFKFNAYNLLLSVVDNIDVRNSIGKDTDKFVVLEETGVHYYGYTFKKVACSLKTLDEELARNRLFEDGVYVHGCASVSAEKIVNGGIDLSQGIPHDFGNGVYCFKGGDYKHALSFACNRSYDDFDANLCSNLGLVFFRPSSKPQKICKVEDVVDYNGSLNITWDETNYNAWQKFVKRCRTAGFQPDTIWDYDAYVGLLHDCSSVDDTNKCSTPKKDSDSWEQWCFPPSSYRILRSKECSIFFVEFKVDWTEWEDDEELENCILSL